VNATLCRSLHSVENGRLHNEREHIDMDTHGKIAAGLHIANGIFFVLCALFAGLFLGGMAAFAGHQTADPHAQGFLALLAGFSGLLFGSIALLGAAEIVAAVCYLRGSDGARIMLVVFSVLALLNLPIGTVIGIYALWALLRPEAVARPAAPALAPQA
jgi:hypothetical protein